MSTSLSDLVNTFSEINNNGCKRCIERKNIKSKYDFIEFKNNKLNYKCKEYGKRCYKSISGLIKKFPNVYRFCDGNLDKFILLLRKGVYPYEYMDSWEKSDESSLPPKKAFYSKLDLEDISDKDYNHAQKVWYVFGIRNLGDYHNLYVQTDTFCLQIFLKNSEINVLKYMELILLISYLRLN